MICYAVIDTNVLVSALLSNHADAATVLLVGRLIGGEIVPVYNGEIMCEYREVLNRKKFKFEPDDKLYLIGYRKIRNSGQSFSYGCDFARYERLTLL